VSEGGASAAVPRAPSRGLGERAFDLAIWGGLALLLLAGFREAEIGRIGQLFTGGGNMRQMAAEFIRPNFTDAGRYVADMWLTVQMALWGTAFALVIAIPLGLAGARNMTPVWVWQPVRRISDVLRSVPDLVVGAIFVAAVGLGPLAGVMALAVNTGGVLGKLFSEAVEAIDRAPVEGIRATGAAPLQEIAWGVMPQVAPLWTSYALYRFESNARSATVLSLIGAGGIGQPLFDSINSFAFGQTSAIVIVIVVAVSIIDLMSQGIRTRLL
jgi:phosphonate transport system permease protein